MNSILCNLAPIGCVLLTALPATLSAQSIPESPLVAWAWVQPNSATPSGGYQRTPSGTDITSTRTGIGRFTVTVPDVPADDTVVHATAYGQNGIANIVSWIPNGTGIDVDVATFDPNGRPQDSAFCILCRSGGRNFRSEGFAVADRASAASYVITGAKSWNGNRADPAVQRVGVGRYEVRFPGLNGNAGHVQATPILGAQGAMRRATVQGWSGNPVVARIRTHDAAGNPVDGAFTVSFHREAAPMDVASGSGTHVWANEETATGSYTPSTTYTDSNGTAGPAGGESITRTSTGVYEVELPNVIPSGKSIAIASIYGQTAGHAVVGSWFSRPGGGTVVRVRTFDSAGSPADNRFCLLYLTNDPVGLFADNLPYGDGCAGLGLAANDRPLLGASWTIGLTGVTPTALLGAITIGLADANNPLDGFGAPGCTQYVTGVANITLPNPQTAASFNQVIPSSTAFVGLPLRAQGATLDPSINALGVATSNGLLGVVGDQ
ncbi:MAG: hypothetical protein NXI31_13765 [bacterium]|nr:hypothetical protein [bacterium]